MKDLTRDPTPASSEATGGAHHHLIVRLRSRLKKPPPRKATGAQAGRMRGMAAAGGRDRRSSSLQRAPKLRALRAAAGLAELPHPDCGPGCPSLALWLLPSPCPHSPYLRGPQGSLTLCGPCWPGHCPPSWGLLWAVALTKKLLHGWSSTHGVQATLH